MKNKKIWIHVGMVAAMLVVSLIYFSPVMSGKKVLQHDTESFEAMVKETKDFHEQTGEYAQWNSAMFSGMPGIQVGGKAPVKSVYQPMLNIGNLGFLGLDRDAGVLFFYLIGFYIALLVLGCNPWVSLVGALAFGLGSYNIIIVQAGHITKAWAMAMMAPILAGMILCLRKPREGKDKWKDWLWGSILFTVTLGLQLLCNHIQITYYTIIGAVVLGLTYAVMAVKQRYIKEFFIALGILMAGAALSFASNSRNMLVSMEYSKETMRGGNELTVTPDDLYHNGDKGGDNNAKGLNLDYAYMWSYGIGETYTLLVPNAKGGASPNPDFPTPAIEDGACAKYLDSAGVTESFYKLLFDHVQKQRLNQLGCRDWKDLEQLSQQIERVANDNGLHYEEIVEKEFNIKDIHNFSEFKLWIERVAENETKRIQQEQWMQQKEQVRQNTPYYWGDQPGTSGPVYFGAIVIMLFLLGMIVVKGVDRWWILAASVIAILLSWGSNFMALNEWVFNNLPFYNKLRTPSMSLVLANVCMAIMATLTLKHIFNPKNTEEDRKRITQGLYISAGSLLLILIAVIIASGGFDFTSKSEGWPKFFSFDPIKSDRQSLLLSDSWRSIIFILLAAATIWLFVNRKIKNTGVALALVGALIVIDLWGVDRRYLNTEKHFVEKDYQDNSQDGIKSIEDAIDEEAGRNGDIDYRVFHNNSLLMTSYPSAHHHQIGGYSAVKMSRYQNLLDFYIKYSNTNVLNMLNARYIVENNYQPRRNPNALGNCWLVSNIKAVSTADDEILSLYDFNPANTAVVNTKEFSKMATFSSAVTAGDTIWMEHQTPYNPDYLKYHSKTAGDRLAVFSEIYYAPDWRAYIDGQPAEYIRVNYVLRGLVIPAGEHVIEFKNEAPLFHKLDSVTLISSIILVLVIGGGIYLYYRRFLRSSKEKAEEVPSSKKIMKK